MILATIAATLSLINSAPGSAPAMVDLTTPIVVADRDNGRGDNGSARASGQDQGGSARSAGSAQVRVQQVQARSAPVVREQSGESGHVPQVVPQGQFMRGRVNEQNILHQPPVERIQTNAVESGRSNLGERLRSNAFERPQNFQQEFVGSRGRVNPFATEGRTFPSGGFGRGRVIAVPEGVGRFEGFREGFVPFSRVRISELENERRQFTPFVQERVGEDLTTNVFVVPTTTMLSPTVLQVLPPAPAVFFNEPFVEGFVPFDAVALDDVTVMNEVFAPVAFFEPTTFFVTPTAIVEPVPIALVPVEFVQPTTIALSGDLISVAPGAVEIATDEGIETAFIGPSTFIEEEDGIVAASPVLVPGENVTVFAVDNGGFVDASTIRVNGGFAAVNNVALTGIVSLANPGLGGFVLTTAGQPMTVMVTPQTVIEEGAVPVGVMAIEPVQPVTVVGTVSNGVLVADTVMINA